MIPLIGSIFVIILFALIVEIAATALKLTGLNINIARFQALSALTGTGFTSREAEMVVSHPKRRKIIMVLMIIGPIGFISLLSLMVISIEQKTILAHLIALILLISLIVIFTRSKKFISVFHKAVEGSFKKTDTPRKVELEEVLQLDHDFGICEISVDKNSRFVDKMLSQADFKEKGFIVLAIKRGYEFLAIPQAKDKISEGDILFVFGKFANLKEITNA